MQRTCMIVIAATLLWISPVTGQQREETDRRQLARLAAQAEAMDALVAQLTQSPLGTQRVVGDVFDSGRFPLEVVIQVAGATEFEPAGVQQGGLDIVAVRASIPTNEFLRILETYFAAQEDETTLEAIALQAAAYAQVEELAATGFGQVGDPGRLLPVTGDASVDSAEYLRGLPAEFWEVHCREQGRVRAVLAARDDALRALTAELGGVVIPGSDGLTLAEAIGENFAEVAQASFLNGARATGIRYAVDDLQVDVRVEVSLRDVALAAKGYLTNEGSTGSERLGMVERWVITMADESRRGEGSARVEREFRSDGGEPLYFLGLTVGRHGLEVESFSASGTAPVDESISDVAAAHREAYVAAAYAARCALADRVMGVFVDDAEQRTLGDLMASDPLVERVVWAWLVDAEIVPGSGDINAENVASLTVELPVAPLGDLVRGVAIAGMDPPEATDDEDELQEVLVIDEPINEAPPVEVTEE
jgi:hypothetical protein